MADKSGFDEWIKSVPKRLSSDPLWKSVYYQLAMYLYDMVWEDAVILNRDFRGREIAKQLIRSTGSICANMEEAFGRGIGTPDYRRIMRIALGEARETQGWLFRSRHIFNPDLVERRLDVVSQVTALLVGVVSK